uniref:Uncharacterized protein n=1 Tax=Rhizophora mucronata TaxID=61149 RepID=A0A2P2Q838_RHIMU
MRPPRAKAISAPSHGIFLFIVLLAFRALSFDHLNLQHSSQEEELDAGNMCECARFLTDYSK